MDSEGAVPAQPTPDALPGVNISGGQNTIVGDLVGGDKYVFTAEQAYNVEGLANPYLGLSAYTYAERAKYAGREKLVAETVANLTAPALPSPLLFVTGASGSGKSSFAQAGLIPALQEFYQKFKVEFAVMRPASEPLAALADALTRQLGLPPIDTATLTPESFADYLSSNTPAARVNLLVLDQFEEFFTQATASARETMFALLANLPPFAKTRTHMIATMRADYLPELFNHSALYEIAKRGVDLRAMTEAELGEAIRQPLRASSYGREKKFEPALVEKLAQDAAQDAAYLPLLQVTLEEIWRGGSLTLSKYTNLTHAIEARANAVLDYTDFERATPTVKRTDAEKTALLNLLLDLVDVSPDDDVRRDVRRQRTKTELAQVDPKRAQWIQELSNARLLSVESGAGDNAASEVDLIHESLLTNWARLRQAIAERREQLKQRGRFEQALDDWLDKGRDDGYLLEGVRLAQARELKRENDVALQGKDAQEFLDASNRRVEAEQKKELERERRRAQVLRIVAIVASALFLLALAASGFAFLQQREAVAQANKANEANETAQAEAVKRGTAEANALNQANTANRANATAQAEANIRATAQADTLLALDTANHQKATAEAEQKISRSRELAAVALGQLQVDPERALLIAIRANESARTNESEAVLRKALLAAPLTLRGRDYFSGHGPMFSPEASPYGLKIVVTGSDQTVDVWDASSGKELLSLKGDGSVNYPMFSPDGSKIVASGDNHVKVWDATTGKELLSLLVNTAYVTRAMFSPDGSKIVTAGCEGQDKNGVCYFGVIKIWDAASGKELAALNGQGMDVIGATFSPDSSKVVMAGCNERDATGICTTATATAWSVYTGRELALPRGPAASMRSAAFSQDGSKLVLAGCSETDEQGNCTVGMAKVWDTTTGTELATLRGHTNLVVSAMFSLDGGKVVTASDDGTAKVWDASSGAELASLRGHSATVYTATFSPGGNKIVTASRDHTAKIWDAESGKELATLYGHSSDVTGATFSPDGSKIVTDSRDLLVKVWDASMGRELAVLRGHTNLVVSAIFSPDSSKIVTASWDGTARVWDAHTGEALVTLHGKEFEMDSAMFSPDGGKIVTTGGNTAKVWDAKTGTELATLEGHTELVVSATFSPEGSPYGLKIVTASWDGSAKVWDAATFRELATLAANGGGVSGATFSPDGRKILTWGCDQRGSNSSCTIGSVKVWDAAMYRELAALPANITNGQVATFSPDGLPYGLKIAAASGFGTAKVWDAETYQERVTLKGNSDDVTGAIFSADGSKIVTTSRDAVARVWDANTGKELVVLHEPHTVVYRAMFSPDGSKIVTTSDTAMAKVWDAKTGVVFATLEGHSDLVNSAVFSQDGSKIVTASNDRTARVYLVNIQDLITLAKARVPNPPPCQELAPYTGDVCPTPTATATP